MLDLKNIIVQEKAWTKASVAYQFRNRTEAKSESKASPIFPKEGQYYIGTRGEIFQRKAEKNSDVLIMAPEFIHVNDPDKIANTRDRKDKLLKLKLLCEMRDTIREILDKQLLYPDDLITSFNAPWASAQSRLKNLYATFVHAFGPINKVNVQKTGAFNLNGDQNSFVTCPNLREFREDPDCALVSSIEIFNENTHEYGQAEIFTERVLKPQGYGLSFDTAEKAMRFCLYEKGKIDLDFVGSLVSPTRSSDQVLEDLLADGLLFFDPQQKNWISKEEYLSGNIYQKIDAAESFLAPSPKLQRNIDALHAVLPEPLKEIDIDISLGMHWIPASVIKEFTEEVLGYSHVEVHYIADTHKWLVSGLKSDLQKANHEYGTFMRDSLFLLECALQARKPTIQIKTKEEKDDDNNEEPKADAVLQTRLARDKLEKINTAFKNWIFQNSSRAEDIKNIYNKTFNGLVPGKFDGSGMHFPGASISIEPRQHQRNAAWRNVQSGNTLYLHEVGAGKTFASALSLMEMKRLNKIHKPGIVVPNHMLDQFSRDIMRLYPSAHVLVLEDDQFKDENGKMTGNDKLKAFIERAGAYPWDAVILTQSSYDRIESLPSTQLQTLLDDFSNFKNQLQDTPESVYRLRAYLTQECEKRQNAIINFLQLESNLPGDGGLKKNYLTLKEIWQEYLEPLENLNANADDWTGFLEPLISADKAYFEHSGIDYLFIDEGQDFKNLPIISNIEHMSREGSARAIAHDQKLAYLRRNNARYYSTIMTATPVSNAISEQYVMQKYMRPDLFEEAGIKHFDAWVAMFGKEMETIEISPEGSSFRSQSRIAEYKNVPELMRMFHSFADVVLQEDLSYIQLPKLAFDKSQIIRVPQTDAIAEIFESLDERAEKVRGGFVSRQTDNMLKITSAARLATVHTQLVGVATPENEKDKVFYLVEETANRYHANKDKVYTTNDEPDALTGALQIVFSDLGVPKGEGQFSVYDEIKKKLIEKGVPADQIRFIHDYKSSKRKAELFEDCRQGRVSVLLGTTAKLGTGTNVQKRLIAEHQLDAPWRPADIIQRLGRMIRQGNQNQEVEDLRYVMEGSFDLYMWQTLERKLRFILQVLKGDLKTRTAEEIDEVVMPYIEAKMAGSMDNQPLIREKMLAQNRLSKLSLSRQAYEHERQRILFRLKAVSHQMQHFNQDLENICATQINVASHPKGLPALVFAGKECCSDIDTGDALKKTLRAFRKEVKALNEDYFEKDICTLYGYKVTASATRRKITETEEAFGEQNKEKTIKYEFSLKIKDPVDTQVVYYKNDINDFRKPKEILSSAEEVAADLFTDFQLASSKASNAKIFIPLKTEFFIEKLVLALVEQEKTGSDTVIINEYRQKKGRWENAANFREGKSVLLRMGYSSPFELKGYVNEYDSDKFWRPIMGEVGGAVDDLPLDKRQITQVVNIGIKVKAEEARKVLIELMRRSDAQKVLQGFAESYMQLGHNEKLLDRVLKDFIDPSFSTRVVAKTSFLAASDLGITDKDDNEPSSLLSQIFDRYENLALKEEKVNFQIAEFEKERAALDMAKALPFDYEIEYQNLILLLADIDKQLLKKKRLSKKIFSNPGNAAEKFAMPAPF